MYVVLGTITLIAGIVGIVLICSIVRNNTLKKKEGKIIVGKKVSDFYIPFVHPTVYIVEVEYEVNNTVRKKKVMVSDRKVIKCFNDAPINLLYVDKTGRVYWAEDRSQDIIFNIILLAIFSALMFCISVMSLLLNIPL